MASDKEWKRLGTGESETQDASKGLGHIVPVRVYDMLFFSLILLTFVTVWAASQAVGVKTHIIIALIIATIKAGVVTLIFMHLQYESKVIWGIVFYPIFIFMLMIIGTLGDASFKSMPFPPGVAEDVFIPKIVDLHAGEHSDADNAHGQSDHKEGESYGSQDGSEAAH